MKQVEYIFTDKTGTLTRNLMEFFKCSIDGEMYGTGITEIERGAAERKGLKVDEVFSFSGKHLKNAFRRVLHYRIIFSFQVTRPPTMIQEKGFNFNDPRLMCGAWRNEHNPDACKVFLQTTYLVLYNRDDTPS